MVGTVGALYLLGLQGPLLTTATWRLLTGAIPTDPATTWAMLTEATWAGYAAQAAGAWSAPFHQLGYARIDPTTLPGFSNTSGANQSPTGWALLASDGATLIAWGAFDPVPIVLPGIITYLGVGLTDQGVGP